MLIAALAFSNTHKALIPHGGGWGRERGRDEGHMVGGRKEKLQPANPTAMLSLLLPPHCKSEGVAFEVLTGLVGKTQK